MPMLVIILAFVVGTLGGVIGGLMSWWLSRTPPRRERADDLHVDPAVEARIGQAASRWAEAHNRPSAVPLVAGKLRLAYVLNHRRRSRRRWSRW
jgi:membrane protein YqaA with SNARE-associated domain